MLSILVSHSMLTLRLKAIFVFSFRDDIGLPNMYQPPETSWVLKDGKTVDGRRFDLWSFGVMSFELLTRFHMLRSYSCCYLGTDARYGSMKKALQVLYAFMLVEKFLKNLLSEIF
ncbi:hypothetical protein AVEN_271778-1 [Araneus ventricosus]|uniref:Protein kinase domain-containing protein n=1 Tax=Araneus ventricosus TaxID=182803 RepID=A0A4Y2WYU1_ARAVE|nr:hypothetical protein AVEN_271778-1 [Araneus ventricosus]